MKKLIVLLVLISSWNVARSDCMGEYVSIYPTQKEIMPSSLVIVEGHGFAQDLILELGVKYEVYLVSGSDKVRLDLYGSHRGTYSASQTILKPSRLLKEGKTYTLKLDTPENKNYLFKKWNSKASKKEDYSWKVSELLKAKGGSLVIKPIKAGSDYIPFGCGPAVSANFVYKANSGPLNYVSVELKDLTTDKVTKYVLPHPSDDTVKVGHSMCSGPFNYHDGHKYKVRFKSLRHDGSVFSNYSDWVKFNSPVESFSFD